MVEIIWTDPALSDLDAIADFIALENPAAAASLIRRVFSHIEQLQNFPESGIYLPELGPSRYRQIIEPPCRIFYRYHRNTVFILHVMRSERIFRESLLTSRTQP